MDGEPADDLLLARLRQALRPYDEPLDRLRRTTGTTSWAADVWGWYAPPDAEGKSHGTQWGDLGGLSTAEALQALSTALGDYASEGKAWDRRLFRGFARKAGREARKAKAAREREAQEQAVIAAPVDAAPVPPANLPPEVQEWAERVAAALSAAAQDDPSVGEWVEATAAHIRKLHADDRDFQRMRPGDQEEHIRIRVLNAYGSKHGDPMPGALRRAGGGR